MSYAYNPFTDNLDLKGSGGGGGSVTMTPDDGAALTASSFPIEGAQAGTVPVMRTTNVAGTLFWENRTWETQYVVDTSSTVGLRGTFTTVQAAINAAVADGAAVGNYKKIYIRTGTYSENLTIPAGVMLEGYNFNNPFDGIVVPTQTTTISGNHTFSGSCVCGFQNINFVSSSGDLFSGGTVVLCYAQNCLFSETTNQIFDLNGISNCLLSFFNCYFASSGQTIIDLTSSRMNAIDCYFPQKGEITQSDSTVQLINCYGMSKIVSDTGQVEIHGCYFLRPNSGTYILEGDGEGIVRNTIFEGSESQIAIENTMVCTVIACQGGDPSNPSSTQIWEAGFEQSLFMSQQGNVIYGKNFTVTSPTALSVPNDEHWIGVNATTNPVSVLFDATYQQGQVFYVKDITGNAATNNIGITTTGGTITFDGATSLTIDTNYGGYALRFDGTNFNVIPWVDGAVPDSSSNGEALAQSSSSVYISPSNVGYLKTATNITFTQMPFVETTANSAIEPGIANGEVNLLLFQEGEIAEMFFIGAKSIVRPTMDTTGLLVSLDLTDDEGVEYNWGARSNAKNVFTIGTSAAFYLEWSFTLADVTGCDPVGIGFRKVEANNASLAAYTDFVFIGVSETDNSGTVTIKTRLNSGSVTNTNTTDAWTDGQTHVLKVLVSGAGVVTYQIDGSPPTSTAAFTFDNTDQVMPYFHGLHGTTSPGTWHWQSVICGVQ